MAGGNSLVLIPTVLAFLVFAARFYAKERAISRASLSFVMACFSVLVLASYPVMAVLGVGLPHAMMIYGAGGSGLLVLGIVLYIWG
jgi:hypothetical protein